MEINYQKRIRTIHAYFHMLLFTSVFFCGLFGLAKNSEAADWYVDLNATGSNNGTSWANAWTSLRYVDANSGVGSASIQGGDTVYLNGGTTSQMYEISSDSYSEWSPIGGSNATGYVTYMTGAASPSPSGHAGLVIFDGGGACTRWIYPNPASYFNIDGNYNGNQNIKVQNLSNTGAIAVDDGNYGGGSNYKFLYIEFANMGSGFRLPTSSNIEVGWCKLDQIDSEAVGLGDSTGMCTGYDENLVHDNIIYLSQSFWNNGSCGSSDAMGAWGISGGCFSAYNNKILGYYAGDNYCNIGNHGDAVAMPCGVSYVAFYNNLVSDMSNYGFYGECNSSSNATISHVQIFNNDFLMSSTKFNGGNEVAIVLGMQGGGTETYTDTKVLNNTVVNYPSGSAMGLDSTGGPIVTDSTDLFANNFSYLPNGAATNGVSVQPPAVAENNVMFTLLPLGFFVSYPATIPGTFDSSLYDPDITSAATALIDQGINLTSTGITALDSDKSGAARPATGAWDIGAYQYQSGSGTIVPNSPTGLSVE